MENIKIINTLGRGLFGTTYTVEKNNKLYAMKRQKILKSYIEFGTKYPMWREFIFFKWISKLSKTDIIFFMQLIDYKFYSNCYFSNKTEDNTNKLVQKLNKSKHCLDLLFDLKDGTIKHILNILNAKQCFSLAIQCIYAIYLMASNSFVHTDLHMGNIAYTKVDKKSKIKIQLDGINYLIPTYGYQYAIIDYGLIQNKKFDLKKSEEKKYQKHIKYNRDLNVFFINTLTNVQYAIKKKK